MPERDGASAMDFCGHVKCVDHDYKERNSRLGRGGNFWPPVRASAMNRCLRLPSLSQLSSGRVS